jgi:DNA-binding CsgD family transcriptional regulator
LIGYKYGISLDTVRQYIKRTYKKLNINSKGELLAQFR